MFRKQECVAMLLAGGQGSRLYALTQRIAKPAVPYGGKYRIIDFPLSNCVHSGIETVGVLTQYQPLELNEYIGSGQPWDLDRMDAGVHVLPPYQGSQGGDWYRGTANAIYQNLSFIDRYEPAYVLILSGDHIYKMDYARMIAAHKASGADCTIAVMEVEAADAPRYGILHTSEDGRVVDFEEKPKNPRSTLASMGIYVFSYEILRRYLEADEADPASENDFGKNILPAMLRAGERLFAYRFEGYWKDVGTIDSLWEANMDLLNPKAALDLYDPDWKIYSRTPGLPPHFTGRHAKVQNSLVCEGGFVDGEVDFSVLFTGVTVEQDAVVRDSIVMPGAVIGAGATVNYAIVAENAVIGPGAAVGERPENAKRLEDWGITVVAEKVRVGPGARVPARAMLTENLNRDGDDDAQS